MTRNWPFDACDPELDGSIDRSFRPIVCVLKLAPGRYIGGCLDQLPVAKRTKHSLIDSHTPRPQGNWTIVAWHWTGAQIGQPAGSQPQPVWSIAPSQRPDDPACAASVGCDLSVGNKGKSKSGDVINPRNWLDRRWRSANNNLPHLIVTNNWFRPNERGGWPGRLVFRIRHVLIHDVCHHVMKPSTRTPGGWSPGGATFPPVLSTWSTWDLVGLFISFNTYLSELRVYTYELIGLIPTDHKRAASLGSLRFHCSYIFGVNTVVHTYLMSTGAY